MKVETDGYKIDFTDALDVFKFDETDKTLPTFHGVTALKAVDIIAEFSDVYVFIEIKEYPESHDVDIDWGTKDCEEIDCVKRKKHSVWLKNYLKYKYRDSFLYRYASNKVDKPIIYIVLINFDDAFNLKMKSDLENEIPVSKIPSHWVNPIISKCQVLNIEAWNRNFPKWPAQKIAAAK